MMVDASEWDYMPINSNFEIGIWNFDE